MYKIISLLRQTGILKSSRNTMPISQIFIGFSSSFLAGSAYRECMDNGTWALKINYSNCEPILEEKVGVLILQRSCYPSLWKQSGNHSWHSSSQSLITGKLCCFQTLQTAVSWWQVDSGLWSCKQRASAQMCCTWRDLAWLPLTDSPDSMYFWGLLHFLR